MIKCCLECGEKNRDIAKFCKKCGKSLAIKRETHGTRGYALRKNVVLRERYVIEKLIKAGGMGAVYKAEDLHMKKFSAVKELRPYWIDSEQESRYLIRKFRSEANLLSQLHHMGLPRVTDYFIEEDRYYLVMDFIEGCDLQTLLTEQGNPGLPYRDVLDWGIEICEVLEYLHNYVPPVIYRDLKPSNIMIRTSDSKVILIDFGIACVIQPDLNESQRTKIGTIGFMPPEQYMGKPVLASDIYALGATLYNLFTGIKPLPFIQQTFEGTNISEITPLLEEIISRALKPNLSDRYKKVSEIKQDLQKVLNHLSFSSSIDVKDRDIHEDKPAELDLEELAFDETPPGDFFVDNEGADINIDDDFWEDFTFEEKSLLFDGEEALISDEILPEEEHKFDSGDMIEELILEEITPEEENEFDTEDVENKEELISEEIPPEEENEFDTEDVENKEELISEEIPLREKNAKEIVWDYYNKALDLIDRQKIHEAIELCEKALAIDNEFLEVYYTLGTVYKKVNRSDLAVESYKKYLALKQKKAARKIKGKKEEGLSDGINKEKLEHSKEKKVKEDKEAISHSEILEISQRIIEKTELSRDIIRPVSQKVKPEVHEQVEKRKSLQKQVQAREIPGIEEIKTQGSQIKTDDFKKNLSSAKILTKQGQFTMAIGEYRKILDNNPNMTNIYINMAEVHKKAGEFKPAIKNYEKYLNLNPDDLNIHFEIGLLYKIIGDRTQAIRHFGICINKDAGTSLTKRARRYIEEIRDLSKD